MNFEIMSTTDRASNQVLSLTKNGNTYYVSIYHREDSIFASRENLNLEDAIKVYTKMVEIFANGAFNIQDRISILNSYLMV